MKHCSIELRVLDCTENSSIGLGDYDEFDDDLKDRVEMLLNADCVVELIPYCSFDADED